MNEERDPVADDAAEVPADVPQGEEPEAPRQGEEPEAPRQGEEPEAPRQGEEPEAPPPPAEVAEVAEEFVRGLLEKMGLQADIAGDSDETTGYIDITGEDLGGLIGRRGQTLDALQEITRTAVQRRLRSRVRLLVDVEGYRARRRESLAEYARAMAGRAKERGTEIELEPMNAYERKIVHDAVGTVEGASSFSEGEEPNRKVIVRGA